MNPLKTIGGTIIGGFVLAIIIAVATKGSHHYFGSGTQAVIIWLHVLSGVTWIGLLYYFNFVQVPALGEAAGDEGGPGPAAISSGSIDRSVTLKRYSWSGVPRGFQLIFPTISEVS